MGVNIQRDATIQDLQNQVFSQIKELIPKPKVEEQAPLVIHEVSVEDAIRELMELERLNASPQEHPQ